MRSIYDETIITIVGLTQKVGESAFLSSACFNNEGLSAAFNLWLTRNKSRFLHKENRWKRVKAILAF